ncbi:MAG TPA: DinB family protein [Blastocatellia bacterium]|nr:DinB family protein [Blastocatellia bacterium]
MPIVDSFLTELEREAATTKRVLERVPGDKLDWRPNAKSMSLGQLSLHVAQIPGLVARLIESDSAEPPQFVQQPAQSVNELLSAFESSITQAKTTLNQWDDAAVMAEWKLIKGDKVLMTTPRLGMIRAILLNHWYHHRGQLTVYLRLLDVPLPSVYGPSADENPFA